MKFKLKLLSTSIITTIGCMTILPLNMTYEINAESSVSYEHELDSRRFNEEEINSNENVLMLFSNSQKVIVCDKVDFNEYETPTITINEEDVIELMSIEEEEDVINTYSEKEMELLYKVVEAECTDQDYDSKVNVMSTIINRINDDRFPSTVEKVIYQKSQFSCVQDKRIHKVEITQETKDAVNDVIQNGTVHDALYFFNLKDVKSTKIKRWINRDLKFLFKDTSGHSFYIER